MNYIIAIVGGTRFDLAPKYEGKAKVYNYGRFNLIIWEGGDYNYREYEEVYDEVAAYVSRVNAELKGNRYYNGWVYAEMLTPKEQGQYNDTYCHSFHNWIVSQMLTADEIIVTKVNIGSEDIHERINVWRNKEKVFEIARAISGEMLKTIHLPGSYHHNMLEKSESNIFLLNYPIFEFGFNLPYSIQIIDETYAKGFKKA